MLVYVELLIFANFIWDYISYILLFLHISKASPRLTLYCLKGKKRVCRLDSPYRLKNYNSNDQQRLQYIWTGVPTEVTIYRDGSP
jgi:hypothetical protein